MATRADTVAEQRTWTIAEVADEFGVTHRTVRHYEELRLISPERRGTTRVYHRRDRTRLALILRGKRLGFPLEEIRTIIDLYDAPRGRRSQLQYVLAQIDERRVDLDSAGVTSTTRSRSSTASRRPAGRISTGSPDHAAPSGMLSHVTSETDISASPDTASETRVRTGGAAVVGLLLTAYMAMSEVDRLAGEVLDEQGRAWPFATLLGPGGLLNISGWTVPSFANDQGHIGVWLLAYLVCHTVFILCCARLLSRLIGWGSGWRRPVLALVVLSLLQNLAAATYGRPTPYADGWAYVIRLLTEATWVAALIVTVVVLRRLVGASDSGRRWRAYLRHLGRALLLHRFSVLPLVPIALLALASGLNLLDELPDVQRRWIDGWIGLWHGTAALVALLALSSGLFVIGRLRSDFARVVALGLGTADNGAGDRRPAPVLWIYWLGPALVLLGAALDRFRGVNWLWLMAFVSVPVAVAVLSRVARRQHWAGPRPARPSFEPADIPVFTRTGDVLAVLPLVIGGLALVRSFTPVVALGPLSGPDESLSDWWLAVTLVVLGTAGAVGSWALGARLVRALTSSDSPFGRVLTVGGDPRTGGRSALVQRLSVGMLLFWLAVFLVLNVFPLWVVGAGVLACVLLGLASFSLVLGSLMVIAQDGGAPDVLWRTRLRTAPLTALLVGAVALGGVWGGDATIHGTRNLVDAPASPPRATVAETFAAWSAAPGCSVRSGAFTVRPMFLYAAAGGGIRATYWTSAALDRIVTHTPGGCAAASGLLSSGASGGAVGLTIARNAPPGRGADQVKAIADQTALAVASVGALVRDLVYPATGVPAPPLGESEAMAELDATGNTGWADRAALMEAVWQTQSPALATSFLGSGGAQAHPTGPLVLNSTSLGTGCRVLVSQLDLGPVPPGTDCAATDQPVPGSIDLFGAYPESAAGAGQHCVGPVKSSTAAMFSSRFAYITPAGVIGPCGGVDGHDQLIDGAYAENTGIGTIVDLSSAWLPLVRQANAEQLRTSPTPTLVVPVLVYLDNHPGTDLRPRATTEVEDPMVPIVGKGRAADQQSAPPTLLQRAAGLMTTTSLVDPAACAGTAAARCDDAVRAIEGRRPYPVVVVHGTTAPSVAVPLGWTLSDHSIETMNEALEEQEQRSCRDARQDLVCARGYGSLKDLYAMVNP